MATDRGLKGGCDQRVSGWVRTDVKYASQCEEKEIDTRNGFLAGRTRRPVPGNAEIRQAPVGQPELARELARSRGIPIAPTERSTGQSPLQITNLSNGKTVNATTPVVGSVALASAGAWTLELGKSASPSEWTTIGSGSGNSEGQLGTIDINAVETGVHGPPLHRRLLR